MSDDYDYDDYDEYDAEDEEDVESLYGKCRVRIKAYICLKNPGVNLHCARILL